MPIRGNVFVTPLSSFQDPSWNAEDRARMDTFVARFSTPTQPTLLPLLSCLVWKRKVPGLQYPPDIELEITKLMSK